VSDRLMMAAGATSQSGSEATRTSAWEVIALVVIIAVILLILVKAARALLVRRRNEGL